MSTSSNCKDSENDSSSHNQSPIIPKDLLWRLRNIVYNIDNDEYGPVYDGWYFDLFYDQSEYSILKENDPIISEVHEYPGDSENEGYIVHLGHSGKPKIGAVLVNDDKIYLIPCYDTREVISEYSDSLDDSAWKQMIAENYHLGNIEF